VKDLVNRILMAYQPLYLRGLLMDGQYRLPQPQKAPPAKGKKLIHLAPAFQPERRRVLIATATVAAVGMCAHPALSANEEASPKPTDESRVRRNK
jgi:hypothetical protein